MNVLFFDPQAEVEICRRRLPHWGQTGVMAFITFRTADSLPEPVIRGWRQDRDNWLRRHQINPLARSRVEQLKVLPLAAQREYQDSFSARWHDLLDAGHGACVLRQKPLSAIVSTSLQHFDGSRYELCDFVVMPNHVHLLAAFPGLKEMQLQCRSWKKFTAGEINTFLGQRGTFWQDESFDHLVRSESQFEHFREYIQQNPIRAKLRCGEYQHYRSAD
jgi:putative transposase